MIDLNIPKLNAQAFVLEAGGRGGIQKDRWIDITSHAEGGKLGLGHTTIVRDRGIDPVTFDVQAIGIVGMSKTTRPHGPFSIEVEEGDGPIYTPKKPYEVGIAMTSRYVLGSSALVAVVEARDLSIVPTDPETSEAEKPYLIDEKPLSRQSIPLGKVSLLLVQAGQVLKVASGVDEHAEIYQATYETEDLVVRDSQSNIVGEDDDPQARGGGFGGGTSGHGRGGSSDRRPAHPRHPAGGPGAAAAPETASNRFHRIPPRTT